MSLLHRANQNSSAQPAQQGQAQNQSSGQTPAQQPGNSAQNPPPGNINNSRTGRGRFGGGNTSNPHNNNQTQNLPNQNSNSAFGPGRTNQNQMASWVVSPLCNTVVRFSLDGLGDPFYRLLGHPLNAEFGKANVLAETLEKGGDAVDALAEMLDTAWQGYGMTGAALVYPRLMASWQSVSKPVPMPGLPDWLSDNLDEEQGHKDTGEANEPFKLLRALDLALVLNVLARSRSQLLLAASPLVMSQHYIRRTLLSDDPRLVELALATGCVENVLVSVNKT